MAKIVNLEETRPMPSDMMSVFTLFLDDWLTNIGITSYTLKVGTECQRKIEVRFDSDEEATLMVLHGLPSSLAKRVEIKLN